MSKNMKMLETQISIFKDIKSPSTPYNKPIGYFLMRIKEGSIATANVLKYRETKDEKYKKMLPAATFSGVFSYRAKDKLIKYSQFACLDFDKFKNITDVEKIKANLSKDPCCFAAFISPSGVGVKAVFRTQDNAEKYESFYRAICKKYINVHLDNSTKDISRLCFESYDPNIYINEDAKEWGTVEEEEYNTIGYASNTVAIPLKSENRIIENLQKWFDKKFSVGKGERNNSVFRFACAMNAFGINHITAESYLLRYAEAGFVDTEVRGLIDSAYKRYSHEFATRTFEDVETKRIIEKRINSGTNTAEIKKELEGQNNPIAADDAQFTTMIGKIKDNDDVTVFWEYDFNGRIALVPHKFERYLRENNFFKFYPESSSDTFIFVKRNNNLIEETNKDKMKDFVLNDLRNRVNVGFGPFDYMAKNPKFFKNDFLNMLESVDIELKKDEQHVCYLYYQNCVVEVGLDYHKTIDYIDIDKCVWKNTVIDRDFETFDHHNSVFRSFLWYIAGQDRNSYNCFKSAVGYLLHTYKTTTDNKAIILNDEVISDTPNGRSGKGLFFNAIKQLKKLISINGKSFTFDSQFAFQTVTTDCQVLVFDDVKRNFNFEDLFSLITEGLTIEYKGQGAIKLPVEKSPKIVITTNYTIKGEGGSFDARKHELELSAYFNKDYTPVDQFKHRLFDQWDAAEWHRFDNFMIQCIQYYLKNGLQKQHHKNLEVRKFIGETSNEFYEWAQVDHSLTIGKRYGNTEVLELFVNEYPDFRKTLKIKTLKKWIKTYCDFNNMKYADGVFNNQRYFIIGDEYAASNDDPDSMPF